MRTKTAYEEQVNERTGKKQRVKVGLAPVQREGLEYEFDLVGAMSEDNEMLVDKTRCSFYAGKVLGKPGAKEFQVFADWLKGAKATAPALAATKQEQPAAPKPSPAAAPGAEPPSDVPPEVLQMWQVMTAEKAAGFKRVFEMLRDTLLDQQGGEVGQATFNHVLGLHGVDRWQNFTSLKSAKACTLALYTKLQEITPKAPANEGPVDPPPDPSGSQEMFV